MLNKYILIKVLVYILYGGRLYARTPPHSPLPIAHGCLIHGTAAPVHYLDAIAHRAANVALFGIVHPSAATAVRTGADAHVQNDVVHLTNGYRLSWAACL